MSPLPLAHLQSAAGRCRRPARSGDRVQVGRLAALLAVVVTVGTCSETPTGPDTTAAGPKINIEFQQPVENQVLCGDTVKVAGSATVSAGAVTSIRVEVDGYEVASAESGDFDVTFDSTVSAESGKPQFKDGSHAVTVRAKGEGNAFGVQSLNVRIDNTPPLVEILEPQAGSVHIGKFQIRVKVSDKYLSGGAIFVGSDKVVDIAKQGEFTFEVDRSNQPTGDYIINVIAQDECGHQTPQQNLSVRVLRPPAFDVSATSIDEQVTDGYTAAVLTDCDGDTLVDAIVASEGGVYLRRGIAKLAPDGSTLPGVPITVDGAEVQTILGEGRFGEGEKISDMATSVLILIDLDGDGMKDVAATGVRDAAEVGEDPALGSVPVIEAGLCRKGDLLRIVQRIMIPRAAISGAACSLNPEDTTQDIVLGAESDQAGLMTVFVKAETSCTVKVPHLSEDPVEDGQKPKIVTKIEEVPCGDAAQPGANAGDLHADLADIQSANIFGTTAIYPGPDGVADILCGDFFTQGDDLGRNDVVIGRASVNTVTSCRNDGSGGFLLCKNSQTLTDIGDTSQVVSTDWSGDGQADLIVGSEKSSLIRWLKGDGNGYFFLSPAPNENGTMLLFKPSDMLIGNFGPGGAEYVAIVGNTRSVLLLPTSLIDDAQLLKCFHSYVVGGILQTIMNGDLDNDGFDDLMGIDAGGHWDAKGEVISSAGIAVARGKGDGDYHAGDIYRVCGYAPNSWVWGWREVAGLAVADVNADGKEDLVIVSESTRARNDRCPGQGAAEDQPKPATPLHLYLNNNGAFHDYPRAGEYAPYDSNVYEPASGGWKAPPCGAVLPNISGLVVGKLSDDGIGDMSWTLGGLDYTVGEDYKSGAVACRVNEIFEVCNEYGTEAHGWEEGMAPDPGLCRNYGLVDEGETPLTGFGTSAVTTGAPMPRATLLTFNGVTAGAPLGLLAKDTPLAPGYLTPTLSHSGGRNILGLAAGRFHADDERLDLATVMGPVSNPGEVNMYMAPRVRTFRTNYQAVLGSILYGDPAALSLYGMQCQETMLELVSMPKEDRDRVWTRSFSDVLNSYKFVSYRQIGEDPIAIVTAPVCEGERDSIFTLHNKAGEFTLLRYQQAYRHAKGVKFQIGEGKDIKAFALRDVDGDGCTDVLAAFSDQLGYARGGADHFEKQDFFEVTERDRNGIDLADVNGDGSLDIIILTGDRGTIEFYLGDGKGNFVYDPVGIPVQSAPTEVRKTDIDGDGCPDLAVRSALGVTVLRSTMCDGG